jgi:hypothetical protein
MLVGWGTYALASPTTKARAGREFSRYLPGRNGAQSDLVIAIQDRRTRIPGKVACRCLKPEECAGIGQELHWGNRGVPSKSANSSSLMGANAPGVKRMRPFQQTLFSDYSGGLCNHANFSNGLVMAANQHRLTLFNSLDISGKVRLRIVDDSLES